jgi:hypothetical protein
MIKLAARFQVIYVGIMIWFIGRLLEAASKVDQKIQEEIVALPTAFAFSMGILPRGPVFTVQKQADGTFYCARRNDTVTPDLKISFKHVKHAFLILSFQESTARSFANDRMLLDGDLNLGMIIVRCLDRMECLVLPRFIAVRAVKRYPSISLGQKLNLATRIYFQLLVGFFRRGHV